MRRFYVFLLLILLLAALFAASIVLAEPAPGQDVLLRVDLGLDSAAGRVELAAAPLTPLALAPRPVATIPAIVTPLPQVQDIVDQVDASRLMDTVRELSGEQPALIAGQSYTIETRYTFAAEPLTRATEYAFERFERLGLDVSYHRWTRDDLSFPPNVIAEKRGTTRPDDIVIIGAHLDSILCGQCGDPTIRAPGADDNASGSAAVLMAAELLAPYNFEATLRFVLFTGEEQGLWGSQAYAASVSGENIRGMLNLDMIGWDSRDGPDMDLHARETLVPASMELAALFVEAVASYNLDLLPLIYSNGIGASDHSPFWNQGFPAILAIENYSGDGAIASDFNSHYHSVDDLSVYINQDFFREMTRAALATFAHMGGLRGDCYWADLNCNCQVEALDLTVAAGRWGASPGQWQYHRVYDTDSNGAITVLDVQEFAGQWGWTCQS